jgi:endoglucanase
MTQMGSDQSPRRRTGLAGATAIALILSVFAMGALASTALSRPAKRRPLHLRRRVPAVSIAHWTRALSEARASGLTQQCPEPYSGTRDPSNPLALPVSPGSDPLTGANFFIPGPAHGAAASAIAQLLGLNPERLPDSESWASFDWQLTHGRFAARLAANPSLAHEVDELAKLAAEPQAQRFSIFSMGGGPGAIYHQAEKIYCRNMQSDPGSIPIINTYFLHPALPHCPTPAEVVAYGPTFRRRVDELVAATDRRPAVFLIELDGIGSSRCVQAMGALPEWEADLRYEIDAVQSLPHTVVYMEAGYSDANPVGYTARILNAIGVERIRGFYTNDTHQNWTIDEVRWANRISRLTHGAHFIVNTATNGRGPLRNRDRVRYGNSVLCNAPGRGAGPRDTTATGFPFADAFLWTAPPGNSGGTCRGGPPSGTFWPARAIMLATNANGRLGPGFPSQPY